MLNIKTVFKASFINFFHTVFHNLHNLQLNGYIHLTDSCIFDKNCNKTDFAYSIDFINKKQKIRNVHTFERMNEYISNIKFCEFFNIMQTKNSAFSPLREKKTL